ncbi:MAG: sigma-54 dependent transcriptional regulator [Treponema sp.]|jgi:two-component system response regulator AtoC|nr:sigma-54 dependent transcriptional regulator [Treponema sp.]
MRVLVVDDEKNIRDSLGKYLGLEGMKTRGAENGEAALAMLESESFDAVILDLRLPGMNGQEVLEQIEKRGISSPVIMMSAHGEIPDAVRALKRGAGDYLVKPFDPSELAIKLRALVENRRRENIVEARKRTTGSETMLLGQSPAMLGISRDIDRIACVDVTVLVTGESGTGKEVAAREIHARGPNRDEPFVAVNMGGIHEGLMESELFGHEKGSFTGAMGRKTGLFELAGGGVIFLDEIGEMSMPLQVKLLRVLQERKIRRLGGISDIPVKARIISATNRDPEAMVREGRLRGDLYYRLNVFRIVMPPLRERKEDIPLLAGHLLSQSGRPRYTVAPRAMEKLMSWSFPGNIRELENILERARIYCRDYVIQPEDIDLHGSPAAPVMSVPVVSAPVFPEPPSAPLPEEPPAVSPLDMVEKDAITRALAACGGNRTKAAELLGISRRTILNKIRIYGLK